LLAPLALLVLTTVFKEAMTEAAFDIHDKVADKPAVPPAKRSLPRLALRAGIGAVIAIAAVALPILAYAGILRLTGNIDTVVPGEVYRSAQLSGDRLDQLIHDKKLKAIVNLRGTNRGKDWYDAEAKAAADNHVLLLDIPLSATHVPNPALLGQLISTLDTAPKPFLIHCESGSDRTGLAVALYRLFALSEAPSEARRNLSFYWGHFPWLGSPTIAMDRTFDNVVEGLPAGRRQ
jgi:protein tyrosine phosphatase (PTP) superfamily phosphohydrolase (DUF442 family)